MKIYTHYYIVSLIFLFALNSCEQESIYGSKGGFTISLSDDLTGMVVTKSTPTELGTPLASQFNLQIKNTQTGNPVYDGLCDKTFYQVPPATYDLSASYGTNSVIAFDSPFYKGELTNQTVDASSKNVVIPCSVANALVSVQYMNQLLFDAVFTSYGIVATVEDISFEWKSEDAQKSVYFKSGSVIKFTFKGILKTDNKEVSFPIEEGLPERYNAKDHYILNLSYQAGQSKLDITTEKKEATINETVPQEWLPKPSTTSADFVNHVLTMKETMSPNAVIDLKIARPLQDLKFKFELEDPNYQKLNKEYTLSSLSEEDKNMLEQAGVTLPNLGTSEPSINLSILASNLQTIHGGQTINNFIYINPKANNRWNTGEDGSGEKYTIQVEKPEFNISISEGNIWTKEFTIDEVSITAGNPDIIKQQIKYQYSDDNGTTWNDCNNGQQQRFQEHPQNKYYRIRALYREEIVSDFEDFSLESSEQLPNSNMEDWRTSKANAGDLLYYYPWSDGKESFWDTNNEFTMRYSVTWFPSTYNRFPAVSFTRNAHNGTFAAELRNTGAGPVGTNMGITESNRTPGMLFVGDYTGTTSTAIANGSISINKGREFRNRPSQLSFYYTYSPYDGDGKDTFDALVQVYDTEKNIIGEGSFSSNRLVSDYSLASIKIDYDKYAAETGYIKKAAEIYVFIQSSTASGNNMPCGQKRDLTLGDQGKKNTHYGSVLQIDDIELIYDK